MTTSAPRSKTIAISGQVDPDMRRALAALAKARRQSVSDLLRPAIMAAVESSTLPEEPPCDLHRGGIPVAVRVPMEAREALRRLAAARGSVVSRVMRAVVSEAVAGKEGLAE